MSGGRGPGGYPGPGYGGAEYGDDGYGTGETPAGGEPRWDDSVWQRDQPDAWASPDAGQSRGAPPGYDPQGYDPQGYNGQGYGGQDYDRPGYAAQPYAGQAYEGQAYEGQAYEGQAYEGQGYADRGVPGSVPTFQQQGPPSGPYPRTGAQPVQRSSDAQSAYPGSGPYPAQPGQRGAATGSRPVQRGTGEQRMASAGAGGGYEDPRWEQQGDDSFLPGFGPRDDFEGGRGRGQDRPANGGRGRDAGRGRNSGRGQAPDRGGYDGEYNGYDDPRAPRGTTADPRRRDPREPVGYPDGSGYPGGPTWPGGPDAGGRAGWGDRQQGLMPGRQGSDGRGPDPRTRDPRRGAPGNGNDRDDPRDREAWSRYRGEKRRRSPIRRLAPWIALLVIVIPLALVGWHIYGIWRAKTHPADYVGSGTGPTVTVQVLTAETADQLAPTLYADGVVASTRAFVLAAENSGDSTALEPGYFILKHHMQASLAWAALLNPANRDQAIVTIPEGKRASQVIATLSQVTKIPLKDFQQAIDHPAQLGLPSYADGKVEGFLFPATYPIQPHETALQILQAMVQRYDVEATQTVNLAAAAHKVGLTAREVIIEASMAQAEGGSVSDYPKIARVIINRLKINMPLQFDSVLLYGLNKYAINVTDAQIATPGPYNDFEHDGLPPGPICNPGNAAIEGILNPTPGNWLYFLTVTGGKSEFSHTPLAGQ